MSVRDAPCHSRFHRMQREKQDLVGTEGSREESPAGRLSQATVDVASLSDGELAAFSAELFDACAHIFSGVTRASFDRDMFGSNARSTRIRVFRDGDDRIVGFATVFRHEMPHRGRSVTVFRGWAGLLPGYRGRGRTFGFFTRELLAYRFRHPIRPVYVVSFLIHPSSYIALVRFYGTVYPRRGQPVPDDALRLMSAFADDIGYPPADPADPLVRVTDDATREAKPFWERTDDPDIAYFRERNPGYRSGHALLVMVPLPLWRLLTSAPRYALDRVRRLRADD